MDDQNLARNCITIWCDDYDSLTFKAFRSALLLHNSSWKKIEDADKADFWCLILEQADTNQLLDLYTSLECKPIVIYLGRNFYAPPHSDWVFFKTPLHVSAFYNWYDNQSKNINKKRMDANKDVNKANKDVNKIGTSESTKQSVKEPKTTTNIQTPHWRTHAFKLQHWPNVTVYTDSPEIMIICSALLREWTYYNALPKTELPTAIIEKMLVDAELEKNLIYHPELPSTEQKSSSQNIINDNDNTKSNNEDSSWGFFKNLFNRFVK